MDLTEYKSALSGYINSIENDIKRVQSFQTPEFKSLPVQCADIDKMNDDWIMQLKNNGVQDNSRILYYFKVKSNHTYQFIQEKLKDYKKNNKKNTQGYRALSKINNLKNVSSADILYVGKSLSNFISRFKHHLGLYEDDMYSLQLKYWSCEINLELEMCYAIIELGKDESRFLEQMETALHHYLKPILGRAGH